MAHNITITPGTHTATLPDGTIINPADWTASSLRSAFIVDPAVGVPGRLEVFTYVLSQLVPGSNVIATTAHTNVPRAGDSGLPHDWAFLISSWRADLNLPLEGPVLEWANETTATFWYNGRRYADARLADVIAGRAVLGSESMPIHMREHLGYRVEIDAPGKVTLALHDWLDQDRKKANEEAEAAYRAYEEACARVTEENERTVAEWTRKAELLRHIGGPAAPPRVEAPDLKRRPAPPPARPLPPRKTLTCWISLNGLLKRH